MKGIIFFEDGTAVPFGNITTVMKIVAKFNELMPGLIAQEREQLLSTITKDELRQIVDRLSAGDIEQ